MDSVWVTILVALLGGGAMSALVTAVAQHLRSERVDRMKVLLDGQQKAIELQQKAQLASEESEERLRVALWDQKARITEIEKQYAARMAELEQDNQKLRQQIRQVEQHYTDKCDEYEVIIGELRGEIRRLYGVMRACGIDPDVHTPPPGTGPLHERGLKL